MRAGRFRILVPAAAAAAVLTAPVAVHAATPTATTLPTHVYAPYFEAWTTDSISTIAQQSGAGYFTACSMRATRSASSSRRPSASPRAAPSRRRRP